MANSFLRLGGNTLKKSLPVGWVGDLFIYKYRRSAFSGMCYSALLRSRFPMRLKERGVEVGKYLLWFENQTVHKADVFAFKKYFPETTVVGGQLFVPPPNYLSLFVTDGEKKRGLAPDILLVSGEAFKGQLSKYATKKEDYVVAPSMRYSYLWRLSEKMAERETGSKPRLKNILVTLPQTSEIYLNLLMVAMRAMENADSNAYSIKIKMHPTIRIEQLNKRLKSVGLVVPRSMLSATPLHESLLECDVLVSSESGTILEAICLGIPAIVVVPEIGVDYSPFLPESAGPLYKTIGTAAEAKEAIFKWGCGEMGAVPPGKRAEMGARVLAECFERENDSGFFEYYR
jgi:hypothetical protein